MVFKTFRVKKIIWSSLNTTYPVNNQLIFQGDLIKTIKTYLSLWNHNLTVKTHDNQFKQAMNKTRFKYKLD